MAKARGIPSQHPMTDGRLYDGQFWKATAERAISTVAQSLVAVLGAGGLGVLEVDWVDALSVAGLAGLLAVLKAVAASGQGTGGPGFGTAESTEGALPVYLDEDLDEGFDEDLDEGFDEVLDEEFDEDLDEFEPDVLPGEGRALADPDVHDVVR